MKFRESTIINSVYTGDWTVWRRMVLLGASLGAALRCRRWWRAWMAACSVWRCARMAACSVWRCARMAACSVWRCARPSARALLLALGRGVLSSASEGTARGHDQIHVLCKFYCLNTNQWAIVRLVKVVWSGSVRQTFLFVRASAKLSSNMERNSIYYIIWLCCIAKKINYCFTKLLFYLLWSHQAGCLQQRR